MDPKPSHEPTEFGNELLPPWRWGIICRSQCTGKLILEQGPNAEQRKIYLLLMKMGFRETYWQYVYPNQIGGLIKSPGNDLIELHIRMFSDNRIYCELEFGRSGILHFLNRRMYANNYLTAKLAPHLSVEERRYLCQAIGSYKLRSKYEWEEWSVSNRFYTPAVKAQIRFLSIFGDWRFLAIAMLASFAVSLEMLSDLTAIPFLVAAMIMIYLIAPKKS